MNTPQSAISVETKYFPLAFLLAFCRPHVVINGYDYGKGAWGTQQLPVNPGRYQVRVFAPYLFLREMGANEIVVDVQQGQAVHIRWKAPLFVFMKGKIEVLGVTGSVVAPNAVVASAPSVSSSPSSVPAGWHSDPSGRHELRYWNGSSWTEDVANDGATSKDPVG